MAFVKQTAVMIKVKAWAKSPEGQKRMHDTIKAYREQGVKETKAKSRIVSKNDMARIAEEMIRILQSKAQAAGLPQSVLEHFYSLVYDPPVTVDEKNGVYTVDIYFQDDLSRMSLLITKGKRKGQRTGDGIENIVSLFDAGYEASKPVFGTWHGHEDLGNIRSKTHRDGANFIRDAIDTFNQKYGAEYFVTASASEEYNN